VFRTLVVKIKKTKSIIREHNFTTCKRLRFEFALECVWGGSRERADRAGSPSADASVAHEQNPATAPSLSLVFSLSLNVMGMEHPASTFYRLQFGAALGWWLLVRISTGKTLDEVAMSSVFTRPHWIPSSWLHTLHSPGMRKIIFVLPLSGLFAGALLARDRTPPL